MPHIIVEHSAELPSGLLEALHERLAAQDTVNLAAIKTRSVPVLDAVIGDGGKDAMVHITLKLLPGRDDALKKAMTNGLFETAKNAIAHDGTSISVELVELDAQSYIK